jgi:hypothetical protein
MEATVDADLNSTSHVSQAECGVPPSLPYRLSSGTIGLWLRRGERLGGALRWTAMTIAAPLKRGPTVLEKRASTNTPPEIV